MEYEIPDEPIGKQRRPLDIAGLMRRHGGWQGPAKIQFIAPVQDRKAINIPEEEGVY
jgi:hypothetical protein